MLTRSRRIALCTLAALLFAFTSASAHAQKPVLTKSTDEPGRTPYASSVSQTCPASFCVFSFNPVPAGFRLVVMHATILYQTTTNSVNLVFLQQTPLTYLDILPVPTPAGGGFVISSNPITYYVEPQATPSLTVENAAGGAFSPAVATLTGYLVAIP